MVIHKFAKLLFKKRNQHKCHPQPNEDLSSFHSFQSHVSKLISQLALELKPESNLSLSWFQRCFGLLPFINKAFAKLLVDNDYPITQWDVDSIEEYLNYTMSLLELLNSISSSLSHIGQATLSLAHGLNMTLAETEARMYLKAIQPSGCYRTNFSRHLHTKDKKAKIFSGHKWIVDEGLKEMKSIGFWVCGVLLSCLYGDCKPYMELRKTAGGFENSLVGILDFKISEKLVKKKPSFCEIEEMNNGVALLVDGDEVRHDAAKDLQGKLCELKKLFDDISQEVDHLFNDVMIQRTKLVCN
ncbi:unnamed protein product [Lathyrus sativus]|nr:unnamed protein product [Lathyrus sativus]